MARNATARIPVTPEQKDFFRELVNGTTATYGDVIEYLMSLVMDEGEHPLLAGAKIKPDVMRFLAERDANKKED